MPNFFKDIIIPTHIIENFPKHLKALNNILNQEYKSADFRRKKAKGFKYFGCDTGNQYKDRLLFINYEINGENYLLLIEEIFNHDYHKSKFLNDSKVLKEFLSKYKEQIDLFDQDGPFKTASSLFSDGLELEERKTNLDEIDFNGKEPIIFDKRQQQAIGLSFPGFCVGPAGSGKSSTANNASLVTALNCTSKTQKVVILTSHEHLVSHLEDSFQDSVASYGISPEEIDNVEHLSTDSFIKRIAKIEDKKFVSEKDFEIFYKDYIRKYKARIKQKTQSPSKKDKPNEISSGVFDYLNVNEIYSEFRIISGFETPKEYLEFGAFSLVTPKDQRREVYTVFKEYKDFLAQNKQIDLMLYKIPNENLLNLENEYFIFLDEAQKASLVQILNLYNISRSKLIGYMDPLQDCDGLNTRGAIEQLLFKINGHSPEFKSLDITYRCPANISNFADLILRLRNNISAGIIDSLEASEIISNNSESLGSIQIIHDSFISKSHKEDSSSIISKLNNNPDFVTIVFNEEGKKEALQFFSEDKVVMRQDFDGQEEKQVLLWDPLNTKISLEINTLINEHGITLDNLRRPINRSPSKSKDIELFRIISYFNKLFIASTRAKNNLFIYNPRTRRTKDFLHKTTQLNNILFSGIEVLQDSLELISKAEEIPVQNSPKENISTVISSSTTGGGVQYPDPEEKWFLKAREYILHGDEVNLKRARDVLSSRVKLQGLDINNFIRRTWFEKAFEHFIEGDHKRAFNILLKKLNIESEDAFRFLEAGKIPDLQPSKPKDYTKNIDGLFIKKNKDLYIASVIKTQFSGKMLSTKKKESLLYILLSHDENKERFLKILNHNVELQNFLINEIKSIEQSQENIDLIWSYIEDKLSKNEESVLLKVFFNNESSILFNLGITKKLKPYLLLCKSISDLRILIERNHVIPKIFNGLIEVLNVIPESYATSKKDNLYKGFACTVNEKNVNTINFLFHDLDTRFIVFNFYCALYTKEKALLNFLELAKINNTVLEIVETYISLSRSALNEELKNVLPLDLQLDFKTTKCPIVEMASSPKQIEKLLELAGSKEEILEIVSKVLLADDYPGISPLYSVITCSRLATLKFVELFKNNSTMKKDFANFFEKFPRTVSAIFAIMTVHLKDIFDQMILVCLRDDNILESIFNLINLTANENCDKEPTFLILIFAASREGSVLLLRLAAQNETYLNNTAFAIRKDGCKSILVLIDRKNEMAIKSLIDLAENHDNFKDAFLDAFYNAKASMYSPKSALSKEYPDLMLRVENLNKKHEQKSGFKVRR